MRPLPKFPMRISLLKMPKLAGAMATPHGMLRLPPVTARAMNLPVVSKTLTIPLPRPPTGVKGAPRADCVGDEDLKSRSGGCRRVSRRLGDWDR